MSGAQTQRADVRRSDSLLAIAVALGVIHVISAFVVDSAVATLVFGGLVVGVGVWAHRRPRRMPLLVLLGLFVVEILSFFSYAHDDLVEVILQVLILALSLVGTVAAGRSVRVT